MPTYRVVKVIKFEYEAEADNEQAALDSIPDDARRTILRQKARDVNKVAGSHTIANRTYTPGRVLTRTFAGQTYTATFLPGAKVKLEGGEQDGTFKTLAQATQAIMPGKSVNSWAWWKEEATVRRDMGGTNVPDDGDEQVEPEAEDSPNGEPASKPRGKKRAKKS